MLSCILKCIEVVVSLSLDCYALYTAKVYFSCLQAVRYALYVTFLYMLFKKEEEAVFVFFFLFHEHHVLQNVPRS